MRKDWNRRFTKDIGMADKHTARESTSLVIKQMQMKTQGVTACLPEWPKKLSGNDAKRMLAGMQILAQTFWKTVWQFLKLKQTTYSAIPLLDHQPKENEN